MQGAQLLEGKLEARNVALVAICVEMLADHVPIIDADLVRDVGEVELPLLRERDVQPAVEEGKSSDYARWSANGNGAGGWRGRTDEVPHVQPPLRPAPARVHGADGNQGHASLHSAKQNTHSDQAGADLGLGQSQLISAVHMLNDPIPNRLRPRPSLTPILILPLPHTLNHHCTPRQALLIQLLLSRHNTAPKREQHSQHAAHGQNSTEHPDLRRRGPEQRAHSGQQGEHGRGSVVLDAVALVQRVEHQAESVGAVVVGCGGVDAIATAEPVEDGESAAGAAATALVEVAEGCVGETVFF